MPGPALTVVVSLAIVGVLGFVAGRIQAGRQNGPGGAREPEPRTPAPRTASSAGAGESREASSSDAARDGRSDPTEILREPPERQEAARRELGERPGDPEEAGSPEDAVPGPVGLEDTTAILDRTAPGSPDAAAPGERASAPQASASAEAGPAPAAVDDERRVEILAPAPAFDLPCVTGDGASEIRRTLHDYDGRWLVLVFYPDDFSFVCPTELQAVSQRLDDFERMDCSVLAVSRDSLERHARWIRTPRRQGGVGPLRFPLASDERGVVARAYGVVSGDTGALGRGLFIIDPEGVVQYQALQNSRVGRGTDELLRILAALQTGGLCAGTWGPDSEPMDLARELRSRKVLSNYELLEQLGAGAFGVVYKAQDLVLDRTVALKVLVPERLMSTSSTVAEARAAAALNHPNVCTIYAADDSSGAPLIAMEYIEGETLRERLAGAALEPPRCAGIGAQVASGLAAAHARGIVHGDLKPENIMITPAGTAKILDFGLARKQGRGGGPGAAGTSRAGGGRICGTPRYMSPEQARGRRPGPSGDVFSLALVLLEMLTGKPAVRGETTKEILEGVCRVDGEDLASRVPAPFREIIRRGLVADADARDLQMAEVAARLG